MSENKHTPGPWQVEFAHTQQSSGIVYWQVHDGSDAIACNQFCVAGNAEANAHLIASAPDLLGALKAAREDILDYWLPTTAKGDDNKAALIHRISRAIDKAEGRP